MPPASLVLVALGGLLLARPRRRGAAAVALGALLALYAFSTPLLGWLLISGLETTPAQSPPQARPQAIVVLSAGFVLRAPEFDGPTVDALGLQRLRYAARLARQTGLPVLASGGKSRESESSMAGLMAEALRQDFGVEPRWLEERSTSTYENAIFSAALLREAGVSQIHLVTHAWHMPRARTAFEAAGLIVSPAPTGFTDPPSWRHALIPSTGALRLSYYAMHELIGRLWYRLSDAV
jgi:uncharacterized SAM-binding protein YcdF (DUF218 family)